VTAELNADFSKRVVVRTASMDWRPSPTPTVLRKRLDLVGPAEAGRVTSIVRYQPGSAFPPHDHPGGEEILVLEGAFCDEHGAYPAGTYLLNPEGFRHAPFSHEGCVLFVKLRQYSGADHVAIDTAAASLEPGSHPGWEVLALYRDGAEEIRLSRLAANTRLPEHEHHGGEEILVLKGQLEDGLDSYEEGDWVRFPDGSRHRPFSRGGCRLYVKRGHLPA
jgi:anti-sigma factor ChrR (cupin superfamily)